MSSNNYNGGKRRANKRARQLLKDPNTLLNGKSFKKTYCSWDIKDFREVATSFEYFYKDQVKRWCEGHIYWWRDKKNPPTGEACYNTYQRWYKRK